MIRAVSFLRSVANLRWRSSRAYKSTTRSSDAEALRWDRRLPVTGVVRQRPGDDPNAPLLMILDLPRLAGFSESSQLVAAE
jgi:hypothetical protein